MKVLIIGGGLLGLSTAWNLRKHGAEVTLVDRNEGVGRETSFANGAMLTPSMADPWNAPGVLRKLIGCIGQEDAPLLLRLHALPSLLGWGWLFLRNSNRERFLANMRKNAVLAAYSVDALRALRNETDIEYDMSTSGTLKIFRDSTALQPVAKLAKMIADLGIRHQVLDRDGVVEKEPALTAVANDIAGGIYYANDESGDAYLYCRRLHALCEERSVAFHFNTVVRKLTCSRGRITSAIADDQQFDFDAVVVAAGSHSAALVQSVGISLPIRPAKGYSLTMPRGQWKAAPRMPVIDDHLHAAVIPMGERLRVAGTAEFAGFDSSIKRTRIDNLLRLLGGIYPEFVTGLRTDSIVPWVGFRPMCADGVPILGGTPIENLFLNTGHGHLGWTMAAGSGKAVADLIAGKQPDIALGDYSLKRFD
jgi:D-amino-acid dehydrogenase